MNLTINSQLTPEFINFYSHFFKPETPLVLDVEVLDNYYINMKPVTKEEYLEYLRKLTIMNLLMSHELKTIQETFQQTFQINIPEDLKYETDTGYLKSNLCRILLKYFQNIQRSIGYIFSDYFKTCRQCDNTFTASATFKNNICYVCLNPTEEIKWKI